jgi:diguanylate cyclase (GGDEF)-like protein
MLDSYTQLASKLVNHLTGICVFDHKLRTKGHTGGMNSEAIRHWLQGLDWLQRGTRNATATAFGRQWVSAIPLEQTDGTLLGVFCTQETLTEAPAHASRHARQMRHSLKPLLDCIHREFMAALPVRSRLQSLTERTLELEWLFKLTAEIKRVGDDRQMLEELLEVAGRRVDSALAVVCIPGKNLCVERVLDTNCARVLIPAWHKSKQHLITWAQQHKRPLVLGRMAPGGRRTKCKILAVPVVRDTGQVIGVLGFYNPATTDDFASKHIFLARHLGRQVASVVEMQFDLMTGLYTRGGLEQASGQMREGYDVGDRCIIYIDVDRMHVVNELHGFELGNELIVRIAHLLAAPLLPESAAAARLSADRFAVLMPDDDVEAAEKTAKTIRTAARRLKMGPDDDPVEVTLSCGVTTFVAMPQGLDRALATAELACKNAKKKGGDRVEVYTVDDGSMRRRHEDVMAVGQLRSALKADRLVLYAQRIVPLRSSSLPGGYEILVRMVREDGKLVMPGPLIAAAQRYQLLPSVDRWVTQRALEMLAPYRGMLSSRGVSISINVSGQSICDETFVAQLVQHIKAARLPADCITIEITEQSAVINLARANELIHDLKAVGCQIALDDFGTGANSLTVLKNLQISRVKIDGSFVRDVLSNRNSHSTVRAIVELAGGMSIDTVAEYVENRAIADEVRTLGVDYAQGYAFGKPEPLAGILTTLNDEESQRLHRLFLES